MSNSIRDQILELADQLDTNAQIELISILIAALVDENPTIDETSELQACVDNLNSLL